MNIRGYEIKPDAKLTDADLSCANLSGANLPYADLTCANLPCANLPYANLTGADLTGANLIYANLTLANLTLANLTDADLTGANLSGANLTGADLTGANLSYADLRDVILPDGRTLTEYIAWLPNGLLTQGGKSLTEVLSSWGKHTWDHCPMSTAFDAKSLLSIPECRRNEASLFIALFDGNHIPKPEIT